MMRTKRAMVRSVAAMVAAVGSLVCLAGPADAFDSGTCNNLFGANNVRFAVAFKIDTGAVGKVDFGDHLHLWGAPQGTAVVCSNKARDVAVVGRLFIDTQNDENIFALAKITYFKGDVVGATSEHNVQGNGTANTLVNTLKSGGGFTKIRLRLYRNSVLVHTKDISL
jgi:hypothetical protein